MDWRRTLEALTDNQLTALVAGLPPEVQRHLPRQGSARAAVELRLARLLPDHPDGARSALGTLERWGGPPDARVRRWLDLLAARFQHVPIVGYRTEEFRLSIDEIYVPLSFSHSERGREHRALGRAAHTPNDECVSIEAVLRGVELRPGRSSLRGISVVGAPGSGKTTLLRRVFTAAATRGLSWAGEHGSAGILVGYTPVYLRLSDLWEYALGLGEQEPHDLVGVIDAACQQDVPNVGSRLRAERRKLLVLLDGLDEVPDEPSRLAVSRWLTLQLDAWPDSLFIVTCRTSAWDKGGHGLDSVLVPLEVNGFRREQARHYIQTWFEAVAREYPDPRVATADWNAALRAEAAALQETLFGPTGRASADLVRMARNPLLLSVMCLLHQKRRGRLPNNRARLYEECLTILLNEVYRELERAPGSALSSSIDHTEVALQVLEPVAWRMQSERGEKADAADGPQHQAATSLDEQTLLEEMGAALEALHARDLTPEDLLAVLVERGVLESASIGTWRFSHLTFQEFLAARHAGQRNLEEELAAHLGESWWRETVLLAMAVPGFCARFVRVALRQTLSEAERKLLLDAQAQVARLDPGPYLDVIDDAVEALEAWRTKQQTYETALARPPLTWLQRLLVWLSVSDAPKPVPESPTRPRPPGAAPVAPLPPTGPEARQALELGRVLELPGLRAACVPLRDHPDPALASAVAALLELTPQDARPQPETPAETKEPAPGTRRVVTSHATPIEVVWVPAGTFLMGAQSDDPSAPNHDPLAFSDEAPVHEVTIPQGFWLGRFPVTNAQYGAFVRAAGGREPQSLVADRFNDPDQPVMDVSWFDANAFCAWLADGLAEELQPDLPTEAEWEWAARGDDGRRYPWGDEPPDSSRVFFRDGPGDATAKVGAHPSGTGPFGAHAQAGNVWEWCRSVFRPYEPHARVDHCQADDTAADPLSLRQDARGAPRGVRGGSWVNNARDLRCARRLGLGPGNRGRYLGFRVVFRPPSRPA